MSVLSRRTGLPILNAGRSGDTTGTALERLDRDVLARNPRIVIVLLGGNDFLRRVPRDETFRNLEAIVTRIRSRGAAVVLVGISVGLITDEYGDHYDALARRSSAGFVPDILDGVIGRPDRCRTRSTRTTAATRSSPTGWSRSFGSWPRHVHRSEAPEETQQPPAGPWEPGAGLTNAVPGFLIGMSSWPRHPLVLRIDVINFLNLLGVIW